MTAEEAAAKFAELHNEGELSDDELEGASGGGCYNDDGYLKTTVGYHCDHYEDEGGLGINNTCFRCKWWKSPNSALYAVGAPEPV